MNDVRFHELPQSTRQRILSLEEHFEIRFEQFNVERNDHPINLIVIDTPEHIPVMYDDVYEINWEMYPFFDDIQFDYSFINDDLFENNN